MKPYPEQQLDRIWKALLASKATLLITKEQLSEWVLAEQLARLVWMCTYCYKRMTMPELSLDHILPVKLGGESTIDNLALCCAKCNRFKGPIGEREVYELRCLIESWARRRDPDAFRQRRWLVMAESVETRLSQKPSFRSRKKPERVRFFRSRLP